MGRASPFSSMGPTRDGRWKPEICAGGQYVTAALANDSESFRSSDRALCTERTLTIEGTSMAAPVVTGVIALMLQKNPKLDPEQVKAALRSSVKRDGHTGLGEWNPAYGHGKVDAKRALERL